MITLEKPLVEDLPALRVAIIDRPKTHARKRKVRTCNFTIYGTDDPQVALREITEAIREKNNRLPSSPPKSPRK